MVYGVGRDIRPGAPALTVLFPSRSHLYWIRSSPGTVPPGEMHRPGGPSNGAQEARNGGRRAGFYPQRETHHVPCEIPRRLFQENRVLLAYLVGERFDRHE